MNLASRKQKKMASASVYGEKSGAYFTYIWAIENSSYFLFFKPLSSPVFTVKSTKMTQWKLRLSSFYSNIRLFIKREDEDNDSEPIEIECELSFLNGDGFPLIKRTTTRSFFGRHSSGFSIFVNAIEVFFNRKEEFLPEGILKVRCRMWWKRAEVLNPDVSVGNTRIGVDLYSFVWAIKDFTSRSFGHKATKLVKSDSGVSQLTLEFSSKEYDGKVHINIDIVRADMIKVRGVLGKLAVLDASGAVVCFENIFKYLSENQINLFSKSFETEILLLDKTNLLPDNVLSLRCGIGIVSGPLRNPTEKSGQLEYSEPKAIKTGEAEINFDELDESISVSSCIKQNFPKCYEQGSLSKIDFQAKSTLLLDNKIMQQDNVNRQIDVTPLSDDIITQQDNVTLRADVESFPVQKTSQQDKVSLQDNFNLQPDVESFLEQNNSQQDKVSLQADVESFPDNTIIQQDDKMKEKFPDDSAIDLCQFADILYRFYEDKILTDVILQTSSEDLHVHKVVLCCRSAVFSAMITKNVDMKTNTIIEITENADTLRRLLFYIYRNEVQEMLWQDAIALFKAASKYELLDLKKKCSTVLGLNISRDSFCDILSFAKMYHETDLLETVNEFISHNSSVFSSEAWKKFRKENPELAFDTMERTIYNFSSSIQ